jgi:diaminohydroxyphosphoribosylaminopyrimidine deaminase / 5-amino-6-(5-phosphoribosylamino)uracil reductase
MNTDVEWLRMAIELSRLCPPSNTAFSVGAVIVDADGVELATGYSRELDAHVHAEEAALAKLGRHPGLPGATIYSSMEPCSIRKSRLRSCAQLILGAGVRRVVFADREPDTFVNCEGHELLTTAGVTVVELPELGGQVRTINAHLAL